MGLVDVRRPVVLIVEDEFLLRVHAVEMVAAAGFTVVEAANADEAIEILETRSDITVVFTDIQMPGSMDGLKLARAVRGRWPPIKIVATSGRLNIGKTICLTVGDSCPSLTALSRCPACCARSRALAERLPALSGDPVFHAIMSGVI